MPQVTAFAASMPFGGLPLKFRLGMAAALLAGLGFLMLAPLVDGAANVLLKGSGVAILALTAWQLPVRGSGWLAAVLAFGAAGDMLLALPGLFVAGAASFAVGHGLAIAFYTQHRRQMASLDRLMAAGLILYGLVMPPLLSPGDLPVGLAMVYAVLLCAMAAALWLSRFPRLAAIGALGFVVSDTILVLRMGGGEILGRDLDGALVWFFYFGGQWLITLGVARGLLARDAHGD